MIDAMIRRIFVSQSLVEVEALKARLEQASIPCFIKNRYSSMLAGDVPFAEVFPELWVINEEDGPRAKELLALWRERPAPGTPDWTCRRCGERHEAQFTSCWKCGAEREEPWSGVKQD